ncbi:DUF2165 family protein [Pseudomonas vranovensis]|uniref:DUF2165 domain-containing protein n=1 Tax=Pseudomonas vranovensis TaxID=321661 RepID=A0A423DJD7_9PSED|nr:DUF2165 domain-containing protein [Pseudomonas vranovensis]ROL71676.1 hypothetical protein BHU25_15250 [Pseudomonas vranovensis]
METFSTQGLIRLGKILITAFIGIFGALVVFGNLTDYASNFLFVQHTLSMDTTFPGNALLYRAITSAPLHHAFYGLIIATQALFAVCCLVGAWHLFRQRHAEAERFHRAKRFAVMGCLLGLLIWYLFFQVVGGEWFAMWQSTQWNALATAGRIVDFLFATLIFISLKIDD